MKDPVLFDDWHPVAIAASIGIAELHTAPLLGLELLIWRDKNGQLHAWENRCPHRGTRLSIGHCDGASVTCAYHGWRFGDQGTCTFIPAQPDKPISQAARVRDFHVQEHYGLVWVCPGTPAGAVLPFPEHADPHLRKVVCGPYDVACSGPRIVENFLDMAHFGFIHGGILGDLEHTEVIPYELGDFDAGGRRGILATQCFAWQPQTNSLAHQGSNVEYTYRVVRPLTAILTKLPQEQSDFREAISLHVQPVGEETSRVWIILALTNFAQEEQQLRSFQDTIFLQDKPILENQVPRRLPLRGETSIFCDRMSIAYRRYLEELGLRYGVVADLGYGSVEDLGYGAVSDNAGA